MNETIYKFNCDRRTIIITIVYIAILSLVSVAIWLMYVGGYFSAWFISVVVALLALLTLSIPRRIVVDEQMLSIVCVLEIVEIPLCEIASVRLLRPSEKRLMMPIFGSYGFFGYYGYYLNLSTFERVKFYATELNNLVEIVDIYDDSYYVSCRNSDALITLLGGQIQEHEEEEEEV